MDDKKIRMLEFKLKYEEMAMGKVLKEYFYDDILSNPIKYTNKYLLADDREIVNEYICARGKAKGKIWMISVNPKIMDNEDELLVFVKCIKKMCKKKWINDSKWIIECGEEIDTELGYDNVHCHIRITCDGKRQSEVHRECKNSFKKLGDFMFDKKLGIREDSFIDYINGVKKGKLKEYYKNGVKFNEKYKSIIF